jgi:hypothetical protein
MVNSSPSVSAVSSPSRSRMCSVLTKRFTAAARLPFRCTRCDTAPDASPPPLSTQRGL